MKNLNYIYNTIILKLNENMKKVLNFTICKLIIIT